MPKRAGFVFDTNYHLEMPPMLRFRRMLAFLHANGGQRSIYRSSGDGTSHSPLFHLEKHSRERF